MQNYPLNPCAYMFFHGEFPGNYRFELFIKKGLQNRTNQVNNPKYGSMTLNT